MKNRIQSIVLGSLISMLSLVGALTIFSSFTTDKKEAYSNYDIQRVQKYNQQFYILTSNGQAVAFIKN